MFLILLALLLNLATSSPKTDCHKVLEGVATPAIIPSNTPTVPKEKISEILLADFKIAVQKAGYKILNPNYATGGHATQMLVEKNGKRYLFKRFRDEIEEFPKFLENEYQKARRVYDYETSLRLLNSPQNIFKPHFVNVEKIKIDGETVLRSDFILGESLSSYMNGHFSEESKLKIARQLITAVQRAHEAGVIHRDLKPGNIQIDNNDNIYIIDFGIAAFKDGYPDIGEKAKNIGTLQYASKSQVFGEPANISHDIHSLNIILMELFSGNRLTEGVNTVLIEEQKPPSSKTTDSPVRRFKFAPENFGVSAPLASALYSSTVRSVNEKGLLIENALRLPEEKYYELHGQILRNYLKQTKNYNTVATDILASKGLIQRVDQLVDKSDLTKIVEEVQYLKTEVDNYQGDKNLYGAPNNWLYFHVFEKKIKELKDKGFLK